MIRFAYPEYLFLFPLLVLLIALFYVHRRRRRSKLALLADKKLLDGLLAAHDEKKSNLHFILFIGICFFLLLALIGVEVGTRYEQVSISGVDVVIAVDISGSMNAEDIKPSRLEKSKHEVTTLLSKMGGDRVALVVFAGNAFLQCPMTSDYSAVRLLLNAVTSGSTTSAGTDFQSLSDVAVRAFVKTENGSTVGKALVLFSDGENHTQGTESFIEKMKSENIRIYAVGVGSAQGAPIPIYDASGALKEYKKYNGSVVTTHLEEDILQSMASETGGQYHPVSASESEIDKIYAEISGLQKADHSEYQFTSFENRFQWFLFTAFIGLLVITTISSKKNSSSP